MLEEAEDVLVSTLGKPGVRYVVRFRRKQRGCGEVVLISISAFTFFNTLTRWWRR